jgi:PAS domain S-box-containing protein
VDILSHIANSTWDLIERNQLHDQLLQIGQAIDSVNEAIGISKPTGEHVYQNEAFTRMFGYELDAFASMSPKVLYADPAQAEEVFTGISQGESWKGEIEMVAKDGKRIPVALRADAVRGERGNIIALVGIHMDITESKAMQAELQKAYEEVMRSNKDLEHFAYVASHDLQEPLRMISSYTQLLETRYREMLDEKAQKYIYYAVDGAQRMQRMIQDLLRFSRINTHGRAPEQCDAHHALGQALANLHVLIAEKGALVTNDDLPTVAADESQLVQLFQNLIENAIKFQQTESPRVHIKATWDQGVCDFSVRDNGIGMDEQQQEKVFLIFHRLNNRSQYPGTGIGLAMCKRIVERHGGRIWYRSAPGQGTTMHFTLNCFP